MAEVSSKDDQMDRARNALSLSPIHALNRLDIESVGEMILISGRVDSFYHSQLAQEAVRAVVEGVEVVNKIDVD